MLRILPLDQAQTFITRKAVRLAEAEQTVAPILDAVRKRGDEARQKIEAGADPGAQRRLTEGAPERSFEAVAQHYLAGLERKVLLKKRSPATPRKARWTLRDHTYLGSKPIDSISSQQLLVVQMKI